MHDDAAMEHILRDAMAADVPQLSPKFDARLLWRVRPRRLPPMGRTILAVYAVVAAASAVWLMRDLPIELIAAAIAICSTVAAGAGVYVRRLAVGH